MFIYAIISALAAPPRHPAPPPSGGPSPCHLARGDTTIIILLYNNY